MQAGFGPLSPADHAGSLRKTAIGGKMPTKKKKPTQKARKRTARPAKKAISKAPARRKKTVRKQTPKVGRVKVEFEEIDVIVGIGDNSEEETESAAIDPLDEHYPPDYGGSE
jgi:hypothetical protein